VLISLWSLKGGSGCSVTAALLARSRALTDVDGVILVDLVGDQPHILNCPVTDGQGITDWLAGDRPSPDGLGRIAAEVSPGLRLAWRGTADWSGGDQMASTVLAQLVDHPATIVVDAGCVVGTSHRASLARALAAGSMPSLLVTRACYLALRRVGEVGITPSGIVLLGEPDRALGIADVESAVGAPVVAKITLDPAVARAVDAGLLATRVPRGLSRTLRGVR
jgi:hypothetical protein